LSTRNFIDSCKTYPSRAYLSWYIRSNKNTEDAPSGACRVLRNTLLLCNKERLISFCVLMRATYVEYRRESYFHINIERISRQLSYQSETSAHTLLQYITDIATILTVPPIMIKFESHEMDEIISDRNVALCGVWQRQRGLIHRDTSSDFHFSATPLFLLV